MPASPTRLLGTFVALLAAGALVACGDSDDSSTTTSSAAAPAATTTTSAQAPAGAGTRLALVAEESGGLSFDRRALSAKAGDVTIAFDNPQGNSLPHAVEIEGNGVERETATIQPGATSSVSVTLRPGTYTFYCPVGDHRAQGMEGTLTVK